MRAAWRPWRRRPWPCWPRPTWWRRRNGYWLSWLPGGNWNRPPGGCQSASPAPPWWPRTNQKLLSPNSKRPEPRAKGRWFWPVAIPCGLASAACCCNALAPGPWPSSRRPRRCSWPLPASAGPGRTPAGSACTGVTAHRWRQPCKSAPPPWPCSPTPTRAAPQPCARSCGPQDWRPAMPFGSASGWAIQPNGCNDSRAKQPCLQTSIPSTWCCWWLSRPSHQPSQPPCPCSASRTACSCNYQTVPA